MSDPTPPPILPGTLYLVATPIGNLEDITLRALRTLRECDVIIAEDTRHSARLLAHFQIRKPLLSCFRFNEARRVAQVLEHLKQQQRVALVSDAGSPGISDPGERLVRATLDAGFRVEPVPGPCALIAALTASGLPADQFHFIGFLPHKSGQRQRRLESLRSTPGTLVFYESPHRIQRLLEELAQAYPEADVVLARELTKKFEEFLRGKASELAATARSRSLRGEFVVMLSRPSAPKAAAEAAKPVKQEKEESQWDELKAARE
jgi:16S rRNA (cytidine1402-2'-O)-methyltransferase